MLSCSKKGLFIKVILLLNKNKKFRIETNISNFYLGCYLVIVLYYRTITCSKMLLSRRLLKYGLLQRVNKSLSKK